MPQVRIAVAAKQFDPAHTQAVIRTLHNVRLLELGVEAGPTAAGIELAVRIKQGVAATDAVILPLFPALLIFATERKLGAGMTGDAVLLWRQLFFPFLVGLAYFCHAGILTK